MADDNSIGLEAFIKMDGFKRAADEYNRTLGRMNQETEGTASGISSKFLGVGNAVLSVAGYLSGALVAGAGAAAAAITGFAVSGVNSAMQMESQLSSIGAVLNKTKEEVQPLSDLILDLGLNPQLKVTAEEAADAIELLARNGLSMDEIMQGAAFSTVLLANSTGSSFANAANIATDSMAIFGIEAKDMATAVDGITAVTTNSKFTIDDFALAMANGGAVANSSGVNFDDFNTVIAAIAPQFSSGMTAGTSFKNMLLRLAPTTNTAKDAMQELGLIAEDGTNAFYDSSGALKDMDEVAQILQDTFIGLSEEQRGQYLRTIFGNEAMSSAIGLMELGADSGQSAAEAFGELADQMGQTSAVDSAATRMDNLAGVLEIIGGVIDTVKLQIGQAFLPLLRELADRLLVVADQVGPKVVEFFSMVSGFLETFVTGLLNGQAPISAFLEALRSIGVDTAVTERIQAIVDSIGAFIAQVVTFVSEHSEAFKGALIGIGAVLAGAAIAAAVAGIAGAIAALANPVTLIIAAAGLLGAAWASNWGGIQEKTQAVIDFIRPYIETAVAAIQAFWAEHGDAILAKAHEIWTGIQTAITTVITIIGGIISTTLAAIATWWQAHGDQVIATVTAAFMWIYNTISTIVTAVRDFITGVLTAINAFWQAHGDTIMAIVTNTWEFIKGTIENLMTFIRSIVAAVQSAMEGDWRGFGENLRKATDAAWAQIKNLINTALQNILAFLTDFIPTMRAKFKEMWDRAKEAFREINWSAVGQSIIDGLVSGLTSGGSRVASKLREIAQNALEAAKGFLGIDSPSKAFMAVGRFSMEGMIEGVEQMKKRAAAAVTSVMSSLPGMNVDVSGTLRGAAPGGGLGLRTAQSSAVSLDAASMAALAGLGGDMTKQYILNNNSSETQLQIRDAFSILEMIGA